MVTVKTLHRLYDKQNELSHTYPLTYTARKQLRQIQRILDKLNTEQIAGAERYVLFMTRETLRTLPILRPLFTNDGTVYTRGLLSPDFPVRAKPKWYWPAIEPTPTDGEWIAQKARAEEIMREMRNQ